MAEKTTTAPAPKAKPRPQTCSGCKYIDRSNPSDVVCRRYPPIVLPSATGGVRCFVPNVHPDFDTCGEFELCKAGAK